MQLSRVLKAQINQGKQSDRPSQIDRLTPQVIEESKVFWKTNSLLKNKSLITDRKVSFTEKKTCFKESITVFIFKEVLDLKLRRSYREEVLY